LEQFFPGYATRLLNELKVNGGKKKRLMDDWWLCKSWFRGINIEFVDSLNSGVVLCFFYKQKKNGVTNCNKSI
jgi:hypothetical protein